MHWNFQCEHRVGGFRSSVLSRCAAEVEKRRDSLACALERAGCGDTGTWLEMPETNMKQVKRFPLDDICLLMLQSIKKDGGRQVYRLFVNKHRS